MADRKTWRRPIRTTPETIYLIISLFKSGMMSSDIYWASKKDKSLFGYRVHKSTISKVLKDNGFDAKANTIWGTKLSRKEEKTENEIEFENLNAENYEDVEDVENNEFESMEEPRFELEPAEDFEESVGLGPSEDFEEFPQIEEGEQIQLPESETEYEEFQEPEELDEFKPQKTQELPPIPIRKQLK